MTNYLVIWEGKLQIINNQHVVSDEIYSGLFSKELFFVSYYTNI